jgi:hypothetical protein
MHATRIDRLILALTDDELEAFVSGRTTKRVSGGSALYRPGRHGA